MRYTGQSLLGLFAQVYLLLASEVAIVEVPVAPVPAMLEERIMQATLATSAPSKTALWIARSVATLTILFMLFDAFGKFAKPAPVVDAFARQGMPIALAPVIGTILLVLVVLYIIPKTSTLAAILLTGYLGGATATNLRAGDSLFEILFPVFFGILVWAPRYLTDERIRALIPFHAEE